MLPATLVCSIRTESPDAFRRCCLGSRLKTKASCQKAVKSYYSTLWYCSEIDHRGRCNVALTSRANVRQMTFILVESVVVVVSFST